MNISATTHSVHNMLIQRTGRNTNKCMLWSLSVGFHKKDWKWLKRKEIEQYLIGRNERLSAPYYDVSHVKTDGKRWYLSRYNNIQDAMKGSEGLYFVEIKEGWYD